MKKAETGKRSFRRRAVSLEVKITFRPPASFASTVGLERLALVGRTKNLSETGVAVVVSARNIDRYLKAKDNAFDLELRLPDGALVIKASPIYFSKAMQGTTATYIIGSRFIQTQAGDHARLSAFLRGLPPPPSASTSQ